MIEWLRRVFRPSPHVQAAMDGSADREAHAQEFRAEIERQAAPLDKVIRRNGLEPAVLATFQLRRQP